MYARPKAYVVFVCAIVLLCLCYTASFANSSGAFMSVPFGHSWIRTKLRMEKSGAVTISEKKGNSLTMKGMFEEREALFVFNFVSKKGLSSKILNISSLGDQQDDRSLYESFRVAYALKFGETKEQSRVGGKNSVALTSLWNPDQYISIVLTYNPNAKRFSDNLAVDSPIRLSYMTSKWAK